MCEHVYGAPLIRVARARKVPMFNVWINLDHFQVHPTPSRPNLADQGTARINLGINNNIEFFRQLNLVENNLWKELRIELAQY